jgi:hypothetical protein
MPDTIYITIYIVLEYLVLEYLKKAIREAVS